MQTFRSEEGPSAHNTDTLGKPTQVGVYIGKYSQQ